MGKAEVSNGVYFRWYSDADVESIRREAADKAIELVVRSILAMDAYLYDEDTIRAAVMVARETLNRGK